MNLSLALQGQMQTAKKIRENIDKACGNNSIGIYHTYKLLGDVKCGIKKGSSRGAPKKALGPLWRSFLPHSEACFCLKYINGISATSRINLLSDPLGSHTSPCKDL